MINVNEFFNFLRANDIDNLEPDQLLDLIGLYDMVEKVASQMKEKLFKKAIKDGYSGWNDPEQFSEVDSGFKHHLEKGITDPNNVIDIMNFLAMIYNHLRRKHGF